MWILSRLFIISIIFFHPLALCWLVQLCFATRRQFFNEVKVSAVQIRKLEAENLTHGESARFLCRGKVGLGNEESGVVLEAEKGKVDRLLTNFLRDQSSIFLKRCPLCHLYTDIQPQRTPLLNTGERFACQR